MNTNSQKIRELLQISHKPRILATRDDFHVVQINQFLYVVADIELGEDEDGNPTLSELANTEAIVEMLPDNKISVSEFSELYQFNGQSNLLCHIDLINKGLIHNGYESSITEALNSPGSFTPKGVSSPSFKRAEVLDLPGATYELQLHGTKIIGEGAFEGYPFFSDIHPAVCSIEDLMSLYVTISVLIAKACTLAGDSGFVGCDDWAIASTAA